MQETNSQFVEENTSERFQVEKTFMVPILNLSEQKLIFSAVDGILVSRRSLAIIKK